MIPKVLWMIWLGDNKPEYVDFSVDVFKNVNPTFTVNYLWYKKEDIERLGNLESSKIISIETDIILYNSIKWILKQIKEKDNSLKNNPRKFIQLLANSFRVSLLNKFGGFYVDCDAFPLRPFDDLFDRIDNFQILQSFDGRKIKTDNHFQGQIANFKLENYGYNKNYLFPPIFNKEQHEKRRELFINLKLKYNKDDYKSLCLENKNIYIEHFDLGNWKKNPELCEECCFDKLLKKV